MLNRNLFFIGLSGVFVLLPLLFWQSARKTNPGLSHDEGQEVTLELPVKSARHHLATKDHSKVRKVIVVSSNLANDHVQIKADSPDRSEIPGASTFSAEQRNTPEFQEEIEKILQKRRAFMKEELKISDYEMEQYNA